MEGRKMPKTKISVTVEGSVLKQVDRMARGASRSEIVENALATWLRSRRRESLEKAIEIYYLSLGAADRDEDAEWAELSGSLTRESWR